MGNPRILVDKDLMETDLPGPAKENNSQKNSVIAKANNAPVGDQQQVSPTGDNGNRGDGHGSAGG